MRNRVVDSGNGLPWGKEGGALPPAPIPSTMPPGDTNDTLGTIGSI